MKATDEAIKAKAITQKKRGTIKAKSDFFRSARYGLTLQEHRIIYYAILVNQQRGTRWEPVTLSISDFQKLFDLTGKSYHKRLDELTNNLASKIISVKEKEGNKEHYAKIPWVRGIFYTVKNGQGVVTIKLNPELQLLFEGKPFTQTEFFYLTYFTSQYAERLYEIIKSTSWNKGLIDFNIIDLRNKLAVGDNQYPNYKDLRRRVLLPAIEDINKYTDLEVAIKEKRGRYNKIESVYFVVTKKDVPPLYDRIQSGAIDIGDLDAHGTRQPVKQKQEPLPEPAAAAPCHAKKR